MTTTSEPRAPSAEDGRGARPAGGIYRSRYIGRSQVRAVATHPVPTPAPNAAVVDTTRHDPAAQDQGTVTAAGEAAPTPAPQRVRRTARVLLPVLVSVLTGFVVATAYLAIREPRPTADLGRWAGVAAVAAPSSSADRLAAGVPDPFKTGTAQLTGAPTRLRVPAIGVDTALETLRLGKGGALDPPADFAKAGWYAAGTVPGDRGPAVIAGHVDNQQGAAVFYRLRELQPGDSIRVVRGGKTVTFTVTSTAWYPKKAFPTAEVYGPTPDRQLRLITCGGVFDHRLRSYKDNLVVYAVAG